MAKFIKIFCLTGMGVLLLCLFSCEQKQAPVKAEKQVMVVSKSIELPKKTKPETSGTATLPKNTVKAPPDVKAEKTSVPELKGDVTILPMPVTKDLPVENQNMPVTKGKAKQEVTKTQVASLQALSNKKYDTKGRIDPFIPLLSQKKDESNVAKTEKKKPKRILTPLEKMDLGQFKLVAVVEMKKGTMAMVEEASGKGYEIGVGTYIGRNEGRVSAINKDGIVVKEYVKDFKGNRRARIQEIKFHKGEGGE